MKTSSNVGLVLHLPQELHAEFKAASYKHERSMQKVALFLIKGWLSDGSPEPSTYSKK
jgi:hypothetical protein